MKFSACSCNDVKEARRYRIASVSGNSAREERGLEEAKKVVASDEKSIVCILFIVRRSKRQFGNCIAVTFAIVRWRALCTRLYDDPGCASDEK